MYYDFGTICGKGLRHTFVKESTHLATGPRRILANSTVQRAKCHRAPVRLFTVSFHFSVAQLRSRSFRILSSINNVRFKKNFLLKLVLVDRIQRFVVIYRADFLRITWTFCGRLGYRANWESARLGITVTRNMCAVKITAQYSQLT